MKIHSQGHLEKKISLRPDLGHWTNEKLAYRFVDRWAYCGHAGNIGGNNHL